MYFSIVIPVYNVGGYLRRCIESIRNQTYNDFELIIVDDGSTDETPLICDEYANIDNRITVIHKKNEGVSIARNTGIEQVKGEYILFFDGDDFVEPYCLQELYEIAEKEKCDTVIYGYYRYENNAIKETCLPKFNEQIYIGNDIIKNILPQFIGLSYKKINQWISGDETALYVENPALWRTMVSAKIINDYGLRFNSNLKVGEDTLFTSEYLTYSNKCFIQQKCYYYLVTRETSTIFTYEKKPLFKLEGKISQLQARIEFTQRLKERLNIDITKIWAGTVVMSVVEMAFMLSRKIPNYSYNKRYKLFLTYAHNEYTQKLVKNYKIKKQFSIKLIPFILVKLGMYPVLFFAAKILNIFNYKFNRG